MKLLSQTSALNHKQIPIFALVIMGLKDRLVNKRLNTLAQSIRRQRKFVNLDTAQTAGILWNSKDEAAFEQLKRVLNENNIQWRDLCLVESKKSDSDKHIAKSDFSFLGQPRKTAILDFTRETFDLFIDISLSNRPAAKYIRATSAATMKVGWSDQKPDYFDLSMNVSQQPNAVYLVEQITRYLGEIK
ncbi:MAG: DUF6913 domain-containing protein [Mangrovibacterium sp.]